MLTRRRLKARGLLAVLVAMLLGAPSVALADRKMPAAQPEPGKALVYVYRPASSANATSKATFSLDGQVFVDLPWGGCAFIQAPPGRHELGMRWTGLLAPKPGFHEFRGLGEMLMPPALRSKPDPRTLEPQPDPTLRVATDFVAGQVYLYQLDTRSLAQYTGYQRIEHEYDWRVAPVDPVSGLPTMRECRYVPAREPTSPAG